MAPPVIETDTKTLSADEKAQALEFIAYNTPAIVSRTKRDVEPEVQPQVQREVELFVEPHHFYLDEFEYEREGNDPGKIIIFNHEVFDDTEIPIRRGSRRDVNEIMLCFQRLGFNIKEEDVLTDSTKQQVLDKLDSVLNDKNLLEQANSLIIFFLTHGEANDKLHVKDGELECSQIWTKFNNVLKGKPKMFVFQACKGKFYATTHGNESKFNPVKDPAQLVNIDTFIVNEISTDMIILYSTVEGYVSYRNPLSGSWFIQELCKNFYSYGRRDDVVSLITRVIKCISGNYYVLDDSKSTEEQKQMPIFVSTLSKKFYLNRNKDRHFLLEMKRKQDEIYDMLKEVVDYISKAQ